MSELWRILVVEDDEHLNRNVVTTLANDGYTVQGTGSGADAIRLLWSEEYDVVIGDLKTPGADGLELLQWLRAYRPNTRMIMISALASSSARTQALQNGAVSYLDKPLDLHLLKEELRRLLQQTGFSASLDSFDLLDVIQIITLSRKSIALLVNTGLEERGVLYFQNGELVWAEYGTLSGEEAFFALAAHKNGTVVHQPWQGKITPNVTQPLSRLILQALQYRAKYAETSPPNEPAEKIDHTPFPLDQDVIDDSPFLVLAEEPRSDVDAPGEAAGQQAGTKEWWQRTGSIPINGKGNHAPPVYPLPADTPGADVPSIPIKQKKTYTTSEHFYPAAQKAPPGERSDLPSWLTEQPTSADMPALRPSSLSNTAQMPAIPPSPAEWQPPVPAARTTDPLKERRTIDLPKTAATEAAGPAAASPEWQPARRDVSWRALSGQAQKLAAAAPGAMPETLIVPGTEAPELDRLNRSGPVKVQRAAKRNYASLVAALQTLGYSLTGFVAAAVVGLDGQPIAQVATDDLDIAPLCKFFSQLLYHTLLALGAGQWGGHQDTVITSADCHILLRLIGDAQDVFQVLITTREADPVESLAIMVNVEGAIEAALH